MVEVQGPSLKSWDPLANFETDEARSFKLGILTGTNRLDFGTDLDLDPDQFLIDYYPKGGFVRYFNSSKMRFVIYNGASAEYKSCVTSNLYWTILFLSSFSAFFQCRCSTIMVSK